MQEVQCESKRWLLYWKWLRRKWLRSTIFVVYLFIFKDLKHFFFLCWNRCNPCGRNFFKWRVKRNKCINFLHLWTRRQPHILKPYDALFQHKLRGWLIKKGMISFNISLSVSGHKHFIHYIVESFQCYMLYSPFNDFLSIFSIWI